MVLEKDGETVLTLELAGHMGYSSSGQSFWNYGVRNSGWADLQGSVTLLYNMDAHTTLGTSLTGSTIMDSGIEDWFNVLGLPEDNLWVGMFVNWVY